MTSQKLREIAKQAAGGDWAYQQGKDDTAAFLDSYGVDEAGNPCSATQAEAEALVGKDWTEGLINAVGKTETQKILGKDYIYTDRYNKSADDEIKYFITKMIPLAQESKTSAQWGLDDDPHDEDEQPTEPEEGDYVIQDDRRGGVNVSEAGGKFLGQYEDRDAAEAAIAAKMQKEQYWPNVWWVSDHGNANLISLTASK